MLTYLNNRMMCLVYRARFMQIFQFSFPVVLMFKTRTSRVLCWKVTFERNRMHG